MKGTDPWTSGLRANQHLDAELERYALETLTGNEAGFMAATDLAAAFHTDGRGLKSGGRWSPGGGAPDGAPDGVAGAVAGGSPSL